MTDYGTTDQFQETDHGIFPNSGSTAGSPADYLSWDWKQIGAAIDGGASITGQVGEDLALAIANPRTLYDAADAFEHVRTVLTMVAQCLADEATALAAGDDPPWQGEAASAFLTATLAFSHRVQVNADLLAADPENGTLPARLAENGDHLARAQAYVRAIDSYYSQAALNLGIQPMSNGLVPVTCVPGMAEAMTADMLRWAMEPLIRDYQLTISAIDSLGVLGRSESGDAEAPADTAPTANGSELAAGQAEHATGQATA